MDIADESLAELFEQYKDEVRETIGFLDTELVAIEQDPANSEVIFSLFRHLHSLKGSSKMFNVDNIGHIAHKLEDLMQIIDQDNSILERRPKIVELLFRGNDIFRDVIIRLEEDISYINLTPEHAQFIEEINHQLEMITRREDAFVEAAGNLLGELDSLIASLDEIDTQRLRRYMAELSNIINQLSLDETASGIKYTYQGVDVTSHILSFESGLEKFESGAFSDADIDDFFKALDEMIKSLFEVAEEDIMGVLAELSDGIDMYREKTLDIDAMVIEFFNMILEDIKDQLQTESEGSERRDAAADESGPKDLAVEKPTSVSQVKTIRVDEKKVDHFLDSVGKLITQSEILNHLQYSFRKAGIAPALVRDFAAVNRSISNDIINLQKSIMEVRQVEMDNILKKFPRLVRDISHKMEKEVELVISGERVPIDKSLLEDVEAAMIHLVRNSIDHGLETPDEREAAGKSRRAQISINVLKEESSITIDVSDDGRGIDFSEVRKRAVARGMVSSEDYESMSERDMEGLVFKSGLTTKDEATDISGRGVGMDVVSSNVMKWNGEVIMDNNPGKGLSIRLRIPITNTLLTKEAILLNLSDDMFCLPLDYVVEIVTMPADKIHHHKEQRVFQHRNKVFNIVDIKSLLGMPDSKMSIEEDQTLIILRGKQSERKAIIADEILGQQKIVIKDFEIEAFRRLPYYQGLTLMGDGRVVLVLDAERIVD